MNYYGYIIYHNSPKGGREIARHTKRFFANYEEAMNNAEKWIKENYPDEPRGNFEVYSEHTR